MILLGGRGVLYFNFAEKTYFRQSVPEEQCSLRDIFAEGEPASEMLNRQRTILAILREIGEPVPAIRLVKLAFLIRAETDLKSDSTFYDFVPYHYGPFSFALYRELGALQNYGYIFATQKTVSLSSDMLNPVIHEVRALAPAAHASVRETVRRYASKSTSDLVNDVYVRYPWFASRSRRRVAVSAGQGRAKMAVYTIGYGSTSIDGFLSRLLRSRIEQIIDVRANPVSRKYGFAKRTLNRLANKVGISYRHIPELGIAGADRRNVETPAGYSALFDRYRHTVVQQEMALGAAAALLRDSPSALLCMEANAACCHRRPLAEILSGNTGLPCHHL